MYAKVENNSVVETMARLPKSHTFADGGKTGNFDIMDSATHLSEGYYPWNDVKPAHNPDTQRLVFNNYVIGADVVTSDYTVEDIPIAELKLSKSLEVQALLDGKLESSQFQFDGVTFNFHPGTAMDAAELKSALLSGLPFQPGLSWTAADGSEYVLTEQSFALFGQTIAGHKLTLIGTAKAHVAAINGLTSAQAVVDYDVTAGW